MSSFTAGTGDRVYAATLAGFRGGSTDTLIDIIASEGTTMFEAADEEGARPNGWVSRVIGAATAKNDGFAITVNGSDTIVVIVGVDLERGAPEWDVLAGIGMFSGSFIIDCSGSGRLAGAAN